MYNLKSTVLFAISINKTVHINEYANDYANERRRIRGSVVVTALDFHPINLSLSHAVTQGHLAKILPCTRNVPRPSFCNEEVQDVKRPHYAND